MLFYFFQREYININNNEQHETTSSSSDAAVKSNLTKRRRLHCLPNFNLNMGPSMGLNLIKIGSPNINGPLLFPKLILMVHQKQNIQTIPNFQSLP